MKGKIITVSVMSTFVTSFMGSALNLSIPAISSEFRISAAEAGWIVTSYMLTCTSLAAVFGRIADKVDSKMILVYGLGIFTAGSVGGGLAASMNLLLAFRLVQGVGTAMIYSTSMSLIVRAAEEGENGKVLGYSTAATYAGLSAGPVLGGVLSFHFSWRAVFFAAAAVAGTACFLVLFRIPAKKEEGFQSRTWPSLSSCILYVLSLSALICGMSLASSYVWGWVPAAAGISGLVYYFAKYKKKGSAVLPVHLFRNPVFAWSGTASMINYGTNFVMNYYLSIYLQTVMGYNAQTAGMILIVSPLVQTVLSILTGKLSDRLSPHVLSAAGMAGTAGSAFCLAMISVNTPLWFLLGCLTVSGASCAFFASPNTRIVMEAAGRQNYNLASSILSTLRSLGHSASMAAAGIASGIFIGTASLKDAGAEAVLTSMRYTFFLFSGLCIFGIFMAWKRKV